MSSRLVNVRLDEERLRKAKELRKSGVSLSDVLREAIDDRFERLTPRRSPGDAAAILQSLDERYPMPPDAKPLDYNVHDRRQASEAIRRYLKAKHDRDVEAYLGRQKPTRSRKGKK
jgi:hypothetical protein